MPTAYITAPPDVADELATTLVSERLAACVNQFDIRSIYRWEGDVHDDTVGVRGVVAIQPPHVSSVRPTTMECLKERRPTV